MATKTTEKKSSSKKGVKAPAAINPMDALATDTLLTLLYRALVRLGEPARISEIVREVGEEAVTPGLARQALETHPRRFIAVDRRWDITARYLDQQRPVERTMEELIGLFGAPMPTHLLAAELSQIYSRVHEHFEDVAPRLLHNARFFPVKDGQAYGLRAWLLDTSSDAEADILFYNYLQADALPPFEAAAKGADWENNPAAAAAQVIAAGDGQPVDNRLVQLLAFRALGEDFDPAALYDATYAQGDAVLALPDHRWLPASALDPIRARWQALAAQVVDSVAEEPSAPINPDLPTPPLEVTEDDMEEIRRYFQGREEVVIASELLTPIFEVAPHARSFAADAQILTNALRALPNDFIWVGSDRFRAPGTLPPYLGQVPEFLTFPTLPRFETADGEILDQMLADDAFEGSLGDDVRSAVAQDINDQDTPARTIYPEGVSAEASSLRLVLKAHHKEIGTFPLAQVPPGFFPVEPNIVELTLRDAAGNGYPVYVDYDVQLLYGLFDVYGEIAADSGAVFSLEKTENPAEYRFVNANETDSAVFVSPNRLEELAELRTEVEGGPPMSTYDIARRILEHAGKKGLSFLTLLTEVNLVRRTPRRLLASVLSGYAAFHERSTRWTFDAKKETEGFDKTKTGFLLHR